MVVEPRTPREACSNATRVIVGRTRYGGAGLCEVVIVVPCSNVRKSGTVDLAQ